MLVNMEAWRSLNDCRQASVTLYQQKPCQVLILLGVYAFILLIYIAYILFFQFWCAALKIGFLVCF